MKALVLAIYLYLYNIWPSVGITPFRVSFEMPILLLSTHKSGSLVTAGYKTMHHTVCHNTPNLHCLLPYEVSRVLNFLPILSIVDINTVTT